jgi:RNA polymerase-binding transcription factor DksA
VIKRYLQGVIINRRPTKQHYYANETGIAVDDADYAAARQEAELQAALDRRKAEVALNKILSSVSSSRCKECGETIEAARRGAYVTCISCQRDLERWQRTTGGPRRGAM